MGLIGENGAGKTTTIKCMLNLVRRDGGTDHPAGAWTIWRRSRQIKQDVGVVLDECFFHDSLRAKDVGVILAPVYRGWDEELYRRYLKKFELPEKKLIKEFSRGMKMKLSLAAALAHRPRLLILDEATAGLDPVVRDEILDEFLGFIQDEEHAILISSHITSDLEKIGRLYHLPPPGPGGALGRQGRHSGALRPSWAAPRPSCGTSSPEIWCGCGRAASAVKRWYGTGRPLPGNTPA